MLNAKNIKAVEEIMIKLKEWAIYISLVDANKNEVVYI